MMLPVFRIWQCLVEALIKVLVMRKYDVAAMIDKLTSVRVEKKIQTDRYLQILLGSLQWPRDRLPSYLARRVPRMVLSEK